MSSPQDIIWRHVAQGFVIATVVVVVHEANDGLLQITRGLIRHLVHLLIDALTVSLQFPVGLRMARRRQDVTDPTRPC